MHPQPKILSGINIYPIKSTAGIALTESHVAAEGLRYDRRWAVIDETNAIITPRECPHLLGIQTDIMEEGLHIMIPSQSPVTIPFTPNNKQVLPATLFGNPVHGNHTSQADALLSAYLDIDCRLIFMNESCPRYMLPIYGGGDADRVSYADSAPLLLISMATLDALNERLPDQIGMKNFRPNMVVAGCSADEEDGWKRLQIGEVVFDVSEACKRCVVTTIDPLTQQQSVNQEPLRTLATYKKHPRGGVRFGVNLIPRNEGVVRCGDEIKIIQVHASTM